MNRIPRELPRTNVAKNLSLAAIGVCVLGLTACAPSPIDTDDTGSIALVEEFFAHLEAGEAAEAAALTNMDLADEFINDDFYRASVALPSNARIVATSGYDEIGVTATVAYTLDDAAESVDLDVRVSPRDDGLEISGWEGDSPVSIGPGNAPGTVTVNGVLEYAVADEGNTLTLLPGAYAAEYHDPTGLTHLLGQDSTFTASIPHRYGDGGASSGARLDATAVLLPDVEPGLLVAIEDLQAACAGEHFTGTSCPGELNEAFEQPLDASVTAEWFREPGPEILFIDGNYQATSTYSVRFSDDNVSIMTVSYTGTVTRDAAGAIGFTL
ncbi:hypothetical protein [Occultella gossypii]|uniref:Lipoprotein n=1 Tax=Occultella gossypii TaxID=2800820 RepID=A0ABS7SCQ5_9MICO|nr:hypothetical protein [Occultella gossypii]MBZ2197960.1 hypothetical protein [Occultella gossypii]